MALNTVLLIAAGMGLNVGLQDPTFNMQFAVPVLDQNTSTIDYALPQQSNGPVVVQGQPASPAPTIYQTVAVEAMQGPKVSVQFTNAKPAEVFAWLQRQGASFVVASGVIPSDAAVTLNIVDQPLDSVVNAIATALGGHWVRESGIKVFRPGPSPFAFAQGVPGAPVVRGFGDSKSPEFRALTEKAFDFPKVNVDVQKHFGPEFQKKMELMSKEHEKEMQKRFGPEFQKRMELMSKEHEKEMQKRFGPEFQKKMELMAKDHEKLALEHQKRMEKEFGPEFEIRMKKMSEDMAKRGEKMEVRSRTLTQDRKELIERARVSGQTVQVKDGVVSRTKDGKTEKIAIAKDGVTKLADGTVIRTFGDGKERSVYVEGRPLGRTATAVRGTRTGTPIDAKKFLNTLTPDQKHSQRMRGYVLYMDLTREQKELLGKVPTGKFEIKMNMNGEEVVVRGS